MASGQEPLRIALIGKTGAGKSALGNTLLGHKQFASSVAGESVTFRCDSAVGTLPSGRQIKVVDTPGILDTRGRDVRDEVTKVISYLSPGPHAFIIVLSPGRATTEEKNVIRELRGLFGDESFLEYTIIVMVRKNDITDEDDNPIDIHEYISKLAIQDVRDLYGMCGKRIVAVENKSTKGEKERYASEVELKINSLGGGYFSHAYFLVRQQQRIHEQEIAKLRREIERLARERNDSFCNLL